MAITVLNNQSLFDIAIQHTGNVENAFAIAVANGLSLTEDLTPGMSLEIPSDINSNNEIVGYFTAKGIKPATGLSQNHYDMMNAVQRGIGYMQIGKTFKVS